ncbi:MAG TPA: DUF4271 domain-containing protein [Bacteroidales bacterium]|nr:DUF4271 domain-containing protein [Bacteroidales bacterium]HRZ48014.1 DUF4271 domain-containing protein [Bacteroidales bacterium]
MAPQTDTSLTYRNPVWFQLDSLINPAKDTGAVLSLSDSAFQHAVDTPTLSLFHATAHQARSNLSPSERKPPEKDWLYGVFALLLIMIVLLRILYARDINRLLRSMLFPSKPGTDNRIFDFRFNLFSILFLLINSLSMGLLVLSFLEGFAFLPWLSLNPTTASSLFFGISGAILLLTGFKILSVRIAGSVFSTGKAAVQYQDHLLASVFTSATLVIPLLVINAFSGSKAFLIASLVILVVIAVVRWVRSFILSFNVTGYSAFHFILYFCTLEILPVLIIGKTVLMWLDRQNF